MEAEDEAWEEKMRRWEAQQKAAETPEYDAWFRQQVQIALDETEFFTAEEVEAEARVWREETRRQMLAEGRRVADEVGLEAFSED
jgi:hypothetical protein